ncbi:subtilisin-like serine protease pr1c [Colletotrichum truncatum]|uniref:Subtilisin-like serine protease pr1c n=1 Tax=Colletotrichum truncatum TaxID=5467 RepID=A0ACC3Z2R9_COLTU|nr:subtilisin-like serine protease pr1c [Colletotrichum truncatum]KAF6793301.1 subtilisin-like serine protease pr1c [Colletotrichum truncatum]
MRIKVLAGFGLLWFSGAAAQTSADDPESVLGPITPVTGDSGRYIVKFSEVGSAKFRKRDGQPDTEGFFNTLVDSGKDASPAISFNSQLFHGASFDLKNASNGTFEEIQALPEVEKIWPAALFTIPITGKAVVQSEIPTWNPHNDTNVALAHARGHLGEGVTIAIVDSGIDYNHPALGGGFGQGFKVESGYDFVGDNYEPGDIYIPDEDPSDCNGHGTHVAGIIGSSNEFLPGVAPSAKLRAYKVFGCGGSTYEDVIVAGFLRAHEEGADIISASLGSNRGFSDTPLAEVATSIQAAGTFVSIAAGNAGETNGPWYTSSGGNGIGSTAVGSVEHDELIAFTTIARSSSGDTREIVYLADNGVQWNINGTLPASWTSTPRDHSICDSESAIPDTNVLIIPRADCGWQRTDSNWMRKVDWIFIYNYHGSEWEIPARVRYSPDEQSKGFALITYEDGDWLVSQHESNHTVTFDFVNDSKPAAIGRPSFAGGRIDQFTSWGPTLDARMVPQISAPGGSIFSTFPLGSGGWATLSGTSMATPYISGVAALFFSSHGGKATLGNGGAKLAHEKIVASGKPIHHYDDTDNLASVAHQGAGLVDAFKVIDYTTLVSPAVLNLNDTDHFQSTHDIKITNSGNETVTYHFQHEAGTTIFSKGSGDAWTSISPPYATDEGNVATAKFSVSEVVLGAGESNTFSITFSEPSASDAAKLPVYGGSILVVGSHGETVRVTYMGVKGSIYASDIWEMHRGVPMLLSGYGGLMEEGHNYTFEAGGDVMQPYFNVLWSTREISFDYVARDWNESDWVYPPVPGQHKYFGSFITEPAGLSDTITSFPFKNYPRNAGGVYAKPQNKFAHGDDIPVGEYKILCRALRTFGDPNNLNDWQYKVSPWFRVTREKPPVTETSTTTTVGTNPTPTSTVSLPEPCDATATPISIKASLASGDGSYNLYLYSDFAAIDLTNTKTPLNFTLTNDNHVKAWYDSSYKFFSVHTNANSLIYVYSEGRVSGSYSFLECVVVDGALQCESNGKKALYVCDNNSGLLRHGAEQLDGCQAVTLSVGSRANTNCATTTIPASATEITAVPTTIITSVVATPTSQAST